MPEIHGFSSLSPRHYAQVSLCESVFFVLLPSKTVDGSASFGGKCVLLLVNLCAFCFDNVTHADFERNHSFGTILFPVAQWMYWSLASAHRIFDFATGSPGCSSLRQNLCTWNEYSCDNIDLNDDLKILE